MKRYLVILLTGLFLIGMATMAQAQATRTWVSGVGDDVNPCSRTAPCKTYAGAISKTAANGIISTLDPGGFGAVTITKSIMIDGSEQIAGVLASGTNGIVLSSSLLTSDVVVLRSLEIHGANLTGINGVQILGGGEVYIENCRIQNFNTDGVRIAETTNNFAHKITVRNCDIRNNLRGIEVLPTAPASARVVVSETALGGHNTGAGIDVLTGNNSVSMFNSSSEFNDAGVQLQNATSTIFVVNSLLSHNDKGVNAAAGEVRLNGSSVVGNVTNGLVGTTRCFQSNMIIGNGGTNTCTFSIAPQ